MSQTGSFLGCDAVKICNLSTFRRKTLSPSLWCKRNPCPKQVGRTFQRNFGNLLSECAASHHREQWSSYSRLWKAQSWLAAFLPLLLQIISTFFHPRFFSFVLIAAFVFFSVLYFYFLLCIGDAPWVKQASGSEGVGSIIMYWGCTMGEAGLWQGRRGFNYYVLGMYHGWSRPLAAKARVQLLCIGDVPWVKQASGSEGAGSVSVQSCVSFDVKENLHCDSFVSAYLGIRFRFYSTTAPYAFIHLSMTIYLLANWHSHKKNPGF